MPSIDPEMAKKLAEKNAEAARQVQEMAAAAERAAREQKEGPITPRELDLAPLPTVSDPQVQAGAEFLASVAALAAADDTQEQEKEDESEPKKKDSSAAAMFASIAAANVEAASKKIEPKPVSVSPQKDKDVEMRRNEEPASIPKIGELRVPRTRHVNPGGIQPMQTPHGTFQNITY